MKPIVLLLSVGSLYAAFAAGTPLTCSVTPRLIDVGTFYDGAAVKVEGRAGAGSQVVVAVVGPETEERFKTKDRFGPIWLTAGKVGVSGVPSLLLRFSTGRVRTILTSEAIASHNLDEASVMRNMRIDKQTGVSHDAAKLQAEFVSLKTSEGFYSFGNSGVRTGESGEGISYSLEFRWPRKAPPASYQVRAYEVRGGAVIAKASVPIEVVRTGFPLWLASLAGNRPAIYGITAVLIAALAGFAIDFLTTRLFGGRRETAH